MTARKLLEPERAMSQTMSGLVNAQQRTANRQSWPGAMQQSASELFASTASTGVEFRLGSVTLDPGGWGLIARAGVQISSTPGVPTFTGTETFVVRLKAYDETGVTLLETVDADFWAPAVTEDQWTGGYYADSCLVFGQIKYDETVMVVLSVACTDAEGASHIIPWRAGKILALPF